VSFRELASFRRIHADARSAHATLLSSWSCVFYCSSADCQQNPKMTGQFPDISFLFPLPSPNMNMSSKGKRCHWNAITVCSLIYCWTALPVWIARNYTR